mmetsp:Transcript_3406/g.9846  ORF Transcript_3406/g.9846 Transcript_3406/m.9846 type:complete len:336 (-) Transcript_3406:231-1238(-)
MVWPLKRGTYVRLLRARRVALSTACLASAAFPVPCPRMPSLFPTTTSADTPCTRPARAPLLVRFTSMIFMRKSPVSGGRRSSSSCPCLLFSCSCSKNRCRFLLAFMISARSLLTAPSSLSWGKSPISASSLSISASPMLVSESSLSSSSSLSPSPSSSLPLPAGASGISPSSSSAASASMSAPRSSSSPSVDSAESSWSSSSRAAASSSSDAGASPHLDSCTSISSSSSESNLLDRVGGFPLRAPPADRLLSCAASQVACALRPPEGRRRGLSSSTIRSSKSSGPSSDHVAKLAAGVQDRSGLLRRVEQLVRRAASAKWSAKWLAAPTVCSPQRC